MSGKDLSNTSRTNWAALEVIENENIDYSDIPGVAEYRDEPPSSPTLLPYGEWS